jgi:IS5 family transposase
MNTLLIQVNEFTQLPERFEKLSANGDPLVRLKSLIPWKRFHPLLKKARKQKPHVGPGRPAFNELLMFKILILQRLYHLSDHQMEFQMRDRLTFMRFLGLDWKAPVPDEKTIWLFRQHLLEADMLEELFTCFDAFLTQQGFWAKTGSIVDASIVEVPRQRNSREENAEIKAGQTPKEWAENPAKLRQKDVEARWTQKGHQNYYGYKNHVNVDVVYKLVRKFTVTPASQGDITCLEGLLDEKNPGKKIWGDKAYRSEAVENLLNEKGYESRIHYKPKAGNWLSEEQHRWNHRFSKIRARVEHVFGFMQNSLNGLCIESIGLARAKLTIGLNNLTYNMCRYLQLVHLQEAVV